MDDHHETEFEKSIATTYATYFVSEAETMTIDSQIDVDFEHNITEERHQPLYKSRLKKVDSISFDLLKYKIADYLTPYDRCIHCRLSKMYCKAFTLQNSHLKRYIKYFNQLLTKIHDSCTATKNNPQHNRSGNGKKYLGGIWEVDKPFKLNLGRFDALLKHQVENNDDNNIMYINTNNNQSNIETDNFIEEEKHEDMLNVDIDNYNRVEMTSDYFNILFFLIHYPRFNNEFNDGSQPISGYGGGYYNDNLFDDNIIAINALAHDDDGVRDGNFNESDDNDNDSGDTEIVNLIPTFLNLNGIIFNKNENIGGKLVSHFVKNLILYSYPRYESVPHCWRFIDLDNCNMTDDDLFTFLKSIETHCKKLFDDENNGDICGYYQHWSRQRSWINIECIDLSNNPKITDKHMKYLFEYMMPNYLVNLQKIKLSNCFLTCKTLQYISNFLDHIQTTLNMITLNNNNNNNKDKSIDQVNTITTTTTTTTTTMTTKEKRLKELKLSRIFLNLSSIDVSKNNQIMLVSKQVGRERKQLKAKIKKCKMNINEMDKSGEFGKRLIIQTGSGVEKATLTGPGPKNRRSYEYREQKKYAKKLKKFRQKKGNDKCADCGERNPTWASTKLGVLICIRCAYVHRLMGVDITIVKYNLQSVCNLEPLLILCLIKNYDYM